MTDLWRREPALLTTLIVGLVDAAIILAVAFGAPITGEQKAAIDGAVSAVLALVGLLIAGVLIRSKVTPVIEP